MVTHVKNRLLHIEASKHLVQSASLEVPKSHNVTLDCTLVEVALIKFVKEKPPLMRLWTNTWKWKFVLMSTMWTRSQMVEYSRIYATLPILSWKAMVAAPAFGSTSCWSVLSNGVWTGVRLIKTNIWPQCVRVFLIVHIKALVQPALTTKIHDREMFMKGIDYSYYYEQNE